MTYRLAFSEHFNRSLFSAFLNEDGTRLKEWLHHDVLVNVF